MTYLIMRFATNTPVDKLLDGGLEHGVVTNIYGPAGSGKTNIALAACLACSKSIYIDTEGSFSPERFVQLGGSEKAMKGIELIEVHTWAEQCDAIKGLERLFEREGIMLVVVDSLVSLYRLEMDESRFHEVNKQLATQYSILSRIARKHKIPVLVTNQVYGMRDSSEVEITSRTIAKYWSKALVELKRTGDNCRLAILRKHRSLPEGRKIEFEITKNGLKEMGKFSLF